MEKHTFTIPTISCMHCVKSITDELTELDGVQTVQGDQHSKQVTVEWDTPATLDQITRTLKEINYPAA